MNLFRDLNPGDFIKITKINTGNEYQVQKLKCLNVQVGQVLKVLSMSQNNIVLKTQYKFNLHIRKDVFKEIEFDILDKDSSELKITFFSN